jgi:hypothetical protein
MTNNNTAAAWTLVLSHNLRAAAINALGCLAPSEVVRAHRLATRAVMNAALAG